MLYLVFLLYYLNFLDILSSNLCFKKGDVGDFTIEEYNHFIGNKGYIPIHAIIIKILCGFPFIYTIIFYNYTYFILVNWVLTSINLIYLFVFLNNLICIYEINCISREVELLDRLRKLIRK
jgi:hypothetical protein